MLQLGTASVWSAREAETRPPTQPWKSNKFGLKVDFNNIGMNCNPSRLLEMDVNVWSLECLITEIKFSSGYNAGQQEPLQWQSNIIGFISLSHLDLSQREECTNGISIYFY